MLDFPNAPTIGDLFTSGVLAWRWDGTKWAVGSQGPSGVKGDGVNILRRNGGFEVWQRGAGGSAVIAHPGAAQLYGPDGWYLSVAPLCTMTQVAGLTNGSQSAVKVQRNNGQTSVATMTFGFPLDTDELFPMLGQYVRLSFTAKAGANFTPATGNINAQLVVGTGTPVKFVLGYVAGTIPVLGTQAVTSTATRYQFNSSVVIPVTTRQAEVVFSWTPVGTAGADDSVIIDDVQLEIVPAATGYVSSDFQRLNFEEQLALCQRHYQKTFSYNVAPAQNINADTGEVIASAGRAGAGAFIFIPIRMLVPMRVAPSMGAFNPRPGGAAAQIYDETAGADGTGAAAVAITPHSGRVQGTGAAGTAVGNILGIHVTLDAGI